MKRNGILLNKRYRILLISTLTMTASTYLSAILDGIMVGRILGTVQLYSINLTTCIVFLRSIPVALFTFGGNTIAVMYKGKRENERADSAFTLSFWASMLTSILITVVGIIFVKPTAALLVQGNTELEQSVIDYLIPLWALTPLTALVNHVAAFARTDGLNKLSTALPVVSNVINLGCDYIFMALLGMGIAGAGWATVAGYAVGSLMCIAYFVSKERSVFFTRKATKYINPSSTIIQ